MRFSWNAPFSSTRTKYKAAVLQYLYITSVGSIFLVPWGTIAPYNGILSVFDNGTLVFSVNFNVNPFSVSFRLIGHLAIETEDRSVAVQYTLGLFGYNGTVQ